MQAEFAAACANSLRAGGRLYFATDWADYADHCLEVFESTEGLRNLAGSGFAARPSRITTRFERSAEKDDREVFDLIYERIV